MRRSFKTTAIFTALFLLFILPLAVSALTATITVYSGTIQSSGTGTVNIPVNQSYAVSVIGTCGVACDNILARLYENGQVIMSSPTQVDTRSCSVPQGGRSCAISSWSFTKSSAGSFRYSVLIGNYGKEPGTTVDGPTVSIIQAPAPLPACTSGCQALKQDCKCGATEIKQTPLYCFNQKTFDTLEGCRAEENGGAPPPSGGTGQPPPPGMSTTLILPNLLGENTTLITLLERIYDFIFWFGMAVAPLVLIIAGFLYVISVGDPKKLDTAKHMIIYALVGVALLLLAKGLVNVLKSILGAQ